MLSNLLLSLVSYFTPIAARALTSRAAGGDDDRTWQSAVQDINGINSILTLLPVLTGKVQNVKLIASRILPASFAIAGAGAGRVLAKLQLGILLFSLDLYRNTIADFTYAHDEYVNKYSPSLEHVPSATPERHATGAYINHNPAETYMVEAWFRTEGTPVLVKLRQNNYARIAILYTVYLCIYAGETYLATRNAAIGCETVYICMQAIAVLLWLSATMVVQVKKGQGNPSIGINKLGSTDYRQFRLPMLGRYVESPLLSFELNNLQRYRLFDSKYQNLLLSTMGILILLSAVLDVLATVLVVGKTTWAYPWVGVELLIIVVKIFFCVEPLRQMEISSIERQGAGQPANAPQIAANDRRIPLSFLTCDAWQCAGVWETHTSFKGIEDGNTWTSTTAGLWIGQTYQRLGFADRKYLGVDGPENNLTLLDDRPTLQGNQALQREVLTGLSVVVASNSVASPEFPSALERMAGNIQTTMDPAWFAFGSKDLYLNIRDARWNLIWRRFF